MVDRDGVKEGEKEDSVCLSLWACSDNVPLRGEKLDNYIGPQVKH